VTIADANATAVNFTAEPIPTFTLAGTVSPVPQGIGVTVTLAGTSSATTTTDGLGQYSFAGLSNGSYTVTATRSGYTFTPASRSVTIGDADATGVNFTAEETAAFSISGTIAPAAAGGGATVTLAGTSSATVTADALGNYTITGLRSGSYTVTPAKSGTVFTPANQSVTLSGADVANINFTAQPITISGAISPASNGSGTTVTLSGAATATTTADAAGNYSFNVPRDGAYTVTATKVGFTFTPASRSLTITGASVTAVDFTSQPVPRSTISGTVTPLPAGSGVTVTLGGASTATATTDASGNFAFSALLNGSYTVTPSKPGFTFAPASQPVTVDGADAPGVNFTAQPVATFRISGAVTPAMAGVTVTLSGSAAATTTTDAAGAFTFSGLLNGSYTITPTNAGFAFTPANRSVTVAGSDVAAVDFQAAAAGIKIDTTFITNRSNRATSLTRAGVSTTGSNELVLAFISADNVATQPTAVNTVTGGGLTWQLVRRTNVQRGTAEIWRAFAAAPLTNVTVTATLNQGVAASLIVMSFSGVDTSGLNGSGAIGSTGSGNANPGAPSASLVTTRSNSLVIGVGSDWDRAVARTLGPNQTLVHQFLATDGDTFWVQRTTNLVPLAGTAVTINDTAPTTDRYNMTIAEILAAVP
jgi:hypothetical protein